MNGEACGKNPMRWDCEVQGCFNLKRRPKIEEFAECLPGKIAFSDVDGITEVNNHFLLLEWKGHQGALPIGQSIMFERMTRGLHGRFAVLVVSGDAEAMGVEGICPIWNGTSQGFEPASLEDAKEYIRRWARWARRKNGVAA